jgi:transposase-like protein
MAEKKERVEAAVRKIRRVTLKKCSAEEKVRIVLEGLRCETSIAALCRREGIATNLYCRPAKIAGHPGGARSSPRRASDGW